ncbi:MAG TPA: RES family NAD+ phosphorylase [Chthoniobacterales bacterium]|nr:RES family NAD+ phosphorylase [Chthoniobacterales bacterium]
MRSASRAGIKPMGAKKVRTSLLGKTLPLIQLPDRLIRISKKSYDDPIHWSKLGVHRFDSPVAVYGVLYTSNTVETAILEVFGDQWAEFHEIDSVDLALFDVCELLVTSPLEVVNATGRHLNRLGTDSGLFASTDYSKTQAWARSFMTHHQTPQGIRYNSRKNPTRINYAVFGTPEAQAAIQVERRYPLPNHPDLYRLLLSYNVALL